jgi:hypothetical protein
MTFWETFGCIELALVAWTAVALFFRVISK